MNRTEILNQIKNNPTISVLIIGGGVNGIGVFRELALQGIDVLLVDRGDFCSGASSASSHMVHGGIRYLENGEFRLVREAVRERNRLIHNAPHQVKPLQTVIPIFKWFSGLWNAPLKFLGLLEKPSERGAVIIKVGLLIYDLFTRKQGAVPKHQFVNRSRSIEDHPIINPKIIFTARYFDGSMGSPERICIEMIQDGESVNPKAKAVNYLSVEGAFERNVFLTDQVTGEKYTLEPAIVINASGPWVDLTNANMGNDTRFINGTKGSHLILENPDLRAAIGDNELFFENKDGRIVLIYPMEDKVMIGTSDLPIDDPDKARCTDAEIDYFFEMVKIVFPKIQIKRDQIIFQFSGVRPLPAGDINKPGQISRDHSIEKIDPSSHLSFPIYNLIGGKWTSFRAFSEETTDRVLAALNLHRKIHTRDYPLGGGRDYPVNPDEEAYWIQALSEEYKIPKKDTVSLFDKYGTKAREFAAFMTSETDHPLDFLSNFTKREIEFIARVEKVVHLDDFILRRSKLAKLGQLSHANLDELSKIIGSSLGWSREQINEEIKRVYQILREFHGITL